ncbi:MAG: NAD(P)-dependent oxidoreductase [Candidatus Micrarchaeota archaeon]
MIERCLVEREGSSGMVFGLKVLVTGAKGRLGSKVVAALKKKKHKVTGVDREELDLAEASEKQIEDLVDANDVIVHLAALIDYAAPESRLMKINFHATRKLAHACRKAKVQKIVFASSTSIYRGCEEKPVTESTKPKPVNAYGRSKAKAEQSIRDSHVPFVILRFCAVYGPEFEEGFGPLVRGIRDGRASLVGDGSNRVSFLFVDDAVDAVVKAVEGKVKNEDFIICGEGITQRQAFAKTAKFLGVAAPAKRVSPSLAYAMSYYQLARQKLTGKKAKMLPEHVFTICADRVYGCKRAERLLGWKPKTSFDSGLRKTLPALLKKK